MERYDNVTFCISLARCRTAWLCRFLKPVAITMHDPLKNCASIEELGFKIDAYLATADSPLFVADTATALFYDQIKARFPNARYLFVQRLMTDVKKSMRAASMPADGPLMDAAEQGWFKAFNAAVNQNDFMYHAPYDAMNAHLRNIWRFVGGDRLLSDEYLETLIGQNIQVPFSIQQAQVNQAKLRRLLSTLKL